MKNLTENIENWIEKVYGNYQKKGNSLSQQEIDHIIDWMNSPSAERYQNRLHRISVPAALEHAQKWTEKLNKKAEKLLAQKENIDGTKIIHEFDNGYKMVELQSEESYGREGSLMGHCVYSYYGRDEAVIFSLRDAKNEPHCTIEYDPEDKSIDQIKGKENKAVSAKYQDYILDFLNNYSLLDWRSIYEYDLENIEVENFGNYLFKSMPEKVVYPKDLVAKNSSFKNRFKTLIVEGDLYIENIHQMRQLANNLIVKGDLTLIGCPNLLRLAENICVEGDVEIEGCDNLKLLAKEEVLKGFVYLEDCENYMKIPKTSGELEVTDCPILEKKLERM